MKKEIIIIENLNKDLINIARKIILESHNMEINENREFLENPDRMEQQNPWWHQWGIITHTRMAVRAFQEEVPPYLKKWGISEKIAEFMDEDIDGIKKRVLFIIAIYLHDLGKFKVRKINFNSSGELYYSFPEHEKASGDIIREKYFTEKLKNQFGLTQSQIDYIARSAELHYELGILRDQSKKTDLGYTEDFIKSPLFKKEVKKIITGASDFKWETGLFFLADTLGKTDLRLKNDKDSSEINRVIEEIEKRNLDRNILKNVLQLPVGIKVSEEYFKLISGGMYEQSP